MSRIRATLIWTVVAAAVAVPFIAAAASPLLAWREPVYIVAGFAGIVAMALLLLQPLLAQGRLPGLPMPRGRRVHRVIGGLLVAAVIVHVGGLWITSPPDVVDALLFVSPTPFSVWGVVAMWAIFATALLALLRRRTRLRLRTWRLGHGALASIIVLGSVIHALQIDGTMEIVSKAVLSALVFAASFKAIADLWISSRRRKLR